MQRSAGPRQSPERRRRRGGQRRRTARRGPRRRAGQPPQHRVEREHQGQVDRRGHAGEQDPGRHPVPEQRRVLPDPARAGRRARRARPATAPRDRADAARAPRRRRPAPPRPVSLPARASDRGRAVGHGCVGAGGQPAGRAVPVALVVGDQADPADVPLVLAERRSRGTAAPARWPPRRSAAARRSRRRWRRCAGGPAARCRRSRPARPARRAPCWPRSARRCRSRR